MSICLDIKAILVNNLQNILALRNQKIKKSDDSYVSAGDLLSERLVKNYISEFAADYALISEESEEDNLVNYNSAKVIILDPIDGTENFVSGLKEWGVAVSVYEHGVHIESMLALPELNEFLITGDRVERYESRIAGISSSLSREDLLALEDGYEYRIIGCCVYNMFNVVTGSFATFENPKGAKVWDILPGLNLALENGLKVVVNNELYNGKLLSPNQKYRFKIS